MPTHWNSKSQTQILNFNLFSVVKVDWNYTHVACEDLINKYRYSKKRTHTIGNILLTVLTFKITNSDPQIWPFFTSNQLKMYSFRLWRADKYTKKRTNTISSVIFAVLKLQLINFWDSKSQFKILNFNLFDSKLEWKYMLIRLWLAHKYTKKSDPPH